MFQYAKNDGYVVANISTGFQNEGVLGPKSRHPRNMSDPVSRRYRYYGIRPQGALQHEPSRTYKVMSHHDTRTYMYSLHHDTSRSFL